jgi:hypothetical protein
MGNLKQPRTPIVPSEVKGGNPEISDPTVDVLTNEARITQHGGETSLAPLSLTLGLGGLRTSQTRGNQHLITEGDSTCCYLSSFFLSFLVVQWEDLLTPLIR